MTVTKSWAYRHPVGSEKVTAWAITLERRKYGGEPLGDIYWSTHKPPHRKRMKQVQRKSGATYFAYIDSEDAAGGDGGESLTHRLLKEAIAGLAGTKLKLGAHGEHDVVVTHGEMEKEILTPEGPYYADVYLRFTTESLLGLKWSGEMYIEVHHTHAVPPEKQKSLREARIPLVEVPVLRTFEYPYADEDTTDQREESHVRMLQRMLGGGYLIGNVISNPSSLEYLEMQVPRLRRELTSAEERNVQTANRLEETTKENASLREAIAVITRQRNETREMLDGLGKQFSQRNTKIDELTQSLTAAGATHADLEAEVLSSNRAFWMCVALLVVTAGLCVFLAFGGTAAQG